MIFWTVGLEEDDTWEVNSMVTIRDFAEYICMYESDVVLWDLPEELRNAYFSKAMALLSWLHDNNVKKEAAPQKEYVTGPTGYSFYCRHGCSKPCDDPLCPEAVRYQNLLKATAACQCNNCTCKK